jgi:hypothetical protein
MKLQVVRTQFGKDATNGLLFIDGIFECYTLEDQYQAVKVMHETCIPEGTYDINFRKTGGFHAKYSERYQNAHYGMLHIQDVPNFTYILIHTGNTDEHTSGCLIVGETQQDLDVSDDGFIGYSSNNVSLCSSTGYILISKVVIISSFKSTCNSINVFSFCRFIFIFLFN